MDDFDISTYDIESKINAGEGTGFEFLINDKAKKASQNQHTNSSIDVELNSIGVPPPTPPSQSKSISFLGDMMPGFGFDEQSGGGGGSSTWDGFHSKAPVLSMARNVSSAPQSTSSSSNYVPYTDRDQKRKKKEWIEDMNRWYKRGNLSEPCATTMESSYEDVEDEYKYISNERNRQLSVGIYGQWLTTLSRSIEWGNDYWNLTNMKLEGLGETIEEDLSSYEDDFRELHDRYGHLNSGPEIRVALKLGHKVAAVIYTNSLFNGNPAMAKHMRPFIEAGISQFTGIGGGGGGGRDIPDMPVNLSHGPPPPPIETKNVGNVQRNSFNPERQQKSNASDRPTNGYRPDINMAKGQQTPDIPIFSDKIEPMENQPPIETRRPEMRGPRPNSLLSGLKQKPPPSQFNPPSPPPPPPPSLEFEDVYDDIEDDVSTASARRRRTNTSLSKNTITLDI